MSRKREYTEDEKSVAFAALRAHQYNFKRCAEYTGIPEYQLKAWVQEEEQSKGAVVLEAITGRPRPPQAIADRMRWPVQFLPAQEIHKWANANIIGDGPLYNSDHNHLMDATIGFLWTNVPNQRGGRQIVGTAEMPKLQGSKWTKARGDYQLEEWFGLVPTFLITLDAVHASTIDDASFCSLTEHELYHCGQAVDEYGTPRWRDDGSPKLAMRAHDAEEFIGITRRYGIGAAAEGVAELVRSAERPEIAPARIAAACGNCAVRI